MHCRSSSSVLDHGEHDPHVAEGAGPQDGTQLRLEQGQIRAGTAGRSAAPGTGCVLPARFGPWRRELVGPQVERADDDRPARAQRPAGRPGRPRGAPPRSGRRLGRGRGTRCGTGRRRRRRARGSGAASSGNSMLPSRVMRHAVARSRRAGRAARPARSRTGAAGRRGPLGSGSRVSSSGSRMSDPAVAVHDDHVAAGHVGRGTAQADDGGDFQGAGHDGGVAGPAAAPRWRRRGPCAGRARRSRSGVRSWARTMTGSLSLAAARGAGRAGARIALLDVEQVGRRGGEVLAARCSPAPWRAGG